MIQSNQIPKVKKSSGAFLWLLCRIHLPLGFIIALILCGCIMKSRPKLKDKPPPIIDNTMYELVLSILTEDSNNLYIVHKEIVSMGKYKITKIEKR